MKLHKSVRKVTALAVCAALAVLPLAGCGEKAAEGGVATQTAMGRYIEQPWALPMEGVVNIVAIHKTPDGRIGMLMNGYDGVQHYSSTTDGTDWQTEEPVWLKGLKEIAGFVTDVSFNSKGEGAAAYHPKGEENGGHSIHVAVIGADGAVTATAIGEADTPWAAAAGDEPEEAYMESIAVSEDGQVYLSLNVRNNHPFAGRFDPATGVCTQQYLKGSSGFALVGDNVVQLLYKNSADQVGEVALEQTSLVFSDSTDGEQSRTVSAEMLRPQQYGGGFAMSALDDGTVYAANATGLFRLAAGGESWEQLLDGDLCSLSLPSMRAHGLLPHGENEFLVQFSDDVPKLMNYVYSATTPSRPDTELSVYGMIHNLTLNQAVGVFRKAHPDVVVNLRGAVDADESYTGDDARDILNTELLAGKGPDVILMHGFPLESYIEKGVLADLSPVIQPMVENGELLDNIIDGSRRDGKLWAVPTRFILPTVWGTKEAVAATDSLSALADYAEKNPGKRMFVDMSPDLMLFHFGQVSQNALRTADGRVDVDALERFYTDVKRLTDTAGDTPNLDGEATEYSDLFWWMNQSTDDAGMFAVANAKAELMFGMLNGFESVMVPNGAVYARLVGAVDTVNISSTVPDDEVNDIFRQMPAMEAGVYYPIGLVGINAASRQQELAAELVLAMLAEETQSAELGEGFPVNRAAITYNVERDDDLYSSYSYQGEDGSVEQRVETIWPSHAMRQAVAGQFDSLKAPVIDDQGTLREVIYAGRSCLAGETTARQAAEAVEKETRQWLAE